MVSPTLYTIGLEFRALEDLLEERADGATEADLGVVARWMDELHGALEAKLGRCVAYIREQEALVDARAAEAKRLREAAAVPANRILRLKEAIRFVFEQQGLKRVETDLGSVTLAGNGGKAPLQIDPVNAEELPARFTRPTIDEAAVRAALEAGEHLDFARILPRGSHVRIK